MKLRYYMRGLGIGVFVTAVLMSVTLNGKTEQLTDAEIIERAKALGMEEKYETTVLADNDSDEETESTLQEESSSEPAGQEQAAEKSQEQVAAKPKPEEIETDVDVQTPDSTGKTIRITVNGGDGSGTVARKLAEAGIVADAAAYDKFLCSNGYDKKIRVGAYDIPENATDDEIAKIITTRNN